MSDSMCGQQLNSLQMLKQQKQRQQTSNVAPQGAVIAVDIRTPENLAAIFRVSEAAGFSRVVVISETGVCPFAEKKIKKMSRNTLEALNISYMTEELFIEAHYQYAPLMAIELCTHSTDIFVSELPPGCSFMVGNERNGIPQVLLDICSNAVHIPMYGRNGSMNVSHALAISLYEWRRQQQYTVSG